MLIVFAGLLAWAPVIGIRAARGYNAARRARRDMIDQLGAAAGEVWRRQARRNALARAGLPAPPQRWSGADR